MIPHIARAVAVSLATALVLAAPGPSAWAAAARIVRPSASLNLGSPLGGVAYGANPLGTNLGLPGASLQPASLRFQPAVADPSRAPSPAQAMAQAAAAPRQPSHVALPTAQALRPVAPAVETPPTRQAPAVASLEALAPAAATAGESDLDATRRLTASFDGAANTGRHELPAGPSSPSPEARPSGFVPETRLVADLEKLAASDPAAALAAASTALLDEERSAPVVKIGAMRVLAGLERTMLAETLPVYLAILALGARPDIRAAKERGADPWWYFQREAAKRLARAASSGALLLPDQVMAALAAASKDPNPSVRLAAGDAVRALGGEPALEPALDPVPAPKPKPATAAEMAKDRLVRRVKAALAAALLLASLGGSELYFSHLRESQPPIDIPVAMQLYGASQPEAPPAVREHPPAPSVPSKQSAEQRAQQQTLTQIAESAARTAEALELQGKAVQQLAQPKGFLSSLMVPLLVSVASVVLFVYLLGKMGGMGGRNSPKTKPAMSKTKPETRFADVAGMDESLIEVHEILDFLRDPARFERLGARMPKGVLMEGPPGTGKTLLAKALAGEANASFISISGSDFVEMYVGLGAARVRSLFEEARKSSPAIIFIDEIDAVGKVRTSGSSNGGSAEHDQTINALLKELDGFDNRGGVIVIAATNRVETLDPALTRPGRFDRKIHLGLPEAMGREAILSLHAKRARLAAEVDLGLVARRTSGMSGAFLQNVINEAALLAVREGADAVGAAHIDEAVDRAGIGAKRTVPLSDEEKRSIALHESGHVLANLLNERAELRVPVNKVTILPHGSGALGFAEIAYGDKHLYKRAELEARLDTALGGLVAEKIFNGEWSSGPGSDLETATRVARAMVEQFGMSPGLGLANTAPRPGDPLQRGSFGDGVSARVHAEVNRLLKESMERTERRLRANGDKHRAMIEALLLKETLTADEIERIAHPEAGRGHAAMRSTGWRVTKGQEAV